MDDDEARAMFDDLTADEQERVVAIFKDELAAGWIPRAAEIAAACRLVRAVGG